MPNDKDPVYVSHILEAIGKVDAKTVWDTCQERLPELKRQLLSSR